MSPAFDALVRQLKSLPGLGFRSAERIALHLLVEKPSARSVLEKALHEAGLQISRCPRCGNLAEEGEECAICRDPDRLEGVLCIVENVPDLLAVERSGAYRGRYHVLHGKLSPLHQIGPEALNLDGLRERIEEEGIEEIILAVSNDVEGEATCHYLREEILPANLRVSRIGFGLPSGAGVVLADPLTLRNALEGRRVL